ncbi:MAG TPA: TRAP transporter small permease subunit [Alcaligenaceae bacterium]|nr:TRAP transporter small permease subunit [Alcaligenaceae bacterium]
MSFLLKISSLIDRLNQAVGKAVAWLTLIVVVVSATNAVIRKIFSVSSNAWLELQWYLFGAIFLLAAGYTFLRNEHVRVDVIAQRFSRKTQIYIEIFGVIFFLLPACLLVFWLSVPYFYKSYVLLEQSANTGGLIRWPVKLLIPVGFGLLILSGFSHLIKSIGFLMGKCPDPIKQAEAMQKPETDVVEEIRKNAEAKIEAQRQHLDKGAL